MNIRLTFLGAAVVIALAACGPAADPAANVAVNDVNALVPAAEQNTIVTEVPEDIAAEPATDAPEKPVTNALGPKKVAPAKPAPAPAPKPTEPVSTDPNCAPEHRAAGHC